MIHDRSNNWVFNLVEIPGYKVGGKANWAEEKSKSSPVSLPPILMLSTALPPPIFCLSVYVPLLAPFVLHHPFAPRSPPAFRPLLILIHLELLDIAVLELPLLVFSLLFLTESLLFLTESFLFLTGSVLFLTESVLFILELPQFPLLTLA